MAEWLIIDGNNLLHSDQENLFGLPGTDFTGKRWALARLLDELAGELADKVTIVFDGTIGGRDEAFQASFLQVIFSPRDVTADSLIERLVSQSSNPGMITVVSSDRGERDTVTAAGAGTTTCQHFIELIKDTKQSLAQKLKKTERQALRPRLGEFFPKGK